MKNLHHENFVNNVAILSILKSGDFVIIKGSFTPFIDYGKCLIYGTGKTSILFADESGIDRHCMLANIIIEKI